MINVVEWLPFTCTNTVLCSVLFSLWNTWCPRLVCSLCQDCVNGGRVGRLATLVVVDWTTALHKVCFILTLEVSQCLRIYSLALVLISRTQSRVTLWVSFRWIGGTATHITAAPIVSWS